MSTAIGTPIQYNSAQCEGFGGATLPGLLLSQGPGGADDGADLIVFAPDGSTLVRTSVLSATTATAISSTARPSWAAA